jgi:hypothetical protein
VDIKGFLPVVHITGRLRGGYLSLLHKKKLIVFIFPMFNKYKVVSQF